jgi:hypothetical protein
MDLRGVRPLLGRERVARLAPVAHLQHLGAAGAERAEEADVALPNQVLERRRRRDHDDLRLRPACELDETVEYEAPTDFVFGSANQDQRATRTIHSLVSLRKVTA